MKSSKCIQIALIAAVWGILLTGIYSEAQGAPRQGQPAPSFKETTTTGQAVTQESFKGNVVLVDFFATWCQPCKESIPHLVELYRKYGKQGLTVLGMCADEDNKSLPTFMKLYKIEYPVALASDQIMRSYGVRGIPMLYVLDKKGKMAALFRGSSPDIEQSLEKLIKNLLAEK